MNKKLLSLAVASAVAMPWAAQAGSLTVANQDITLSGGITGAYINNTDLGRDKFAVNDALIDLASEAKPGGMGFNLGFGELAQNNLASSNNTLNVLGSVGMDIQYGWVSVMPMDGLKVDAGLLATNVGSEVAPSYANDNIMRGLVWNAQPVYYTGARATYSMDSMSFYGEVSRDTTTGTLPNGGDGSGLGASGTFGDYRGAVNLFNVVNQGYIVDLIFSGNAGPVKFGANFDYITKADAAKNASPAGSDDSAYGLALYGSMAWDKFSLPVRIEYVDDAKSGIYGLTTTNTAGNPESNTAITFTITPTYNFSDSTFARAEVAYVSTDKKTGAYTDDQGLPTDSNLVVSFQGGVRF